MHTACADDSLSFLKPHQVLKMGTFILSVTGRLLIRWLSLSFRKLIFGSSHHLIEKHLYFICKILWSWRTMDSFCLRRKIRMIWMNWGPQSMRVKKCPDQPHLLLIKQITLCPVTQSPPFTKHRAEQVAIATLDVDLPHKGSKPGDIHIRTWP